MNAQNKVGQTDNFNHVEEDGVLTRAHSDAICMARQARITPDSALKMLKDGNRRFVDNQRVNRDLSQQMRQTATGQYPYAAILGCIDSRVPAEHVFDLGIGDVFSVRIAGNFVNDDILGSLEFATKVAGAKVIVVLGHTHCGAVKGACDNVQLGKLTGLLAKLKPAVDQVAPEFQEVSSSNAALVQKVADVNVMHAVEAIKQHSDLLRQMHQDGEIEIVGGMYDVETGVVSFY